MNDKTLEKKRSGDPSLSEVKESDILNGFWIFGYGALMWQPGFRHATSAVAHLSTHPLSIAESPLVYGVVSCADDLLEALELRRAAYVGAGKIAPDRNAASTEDAFEEAPFHADPLRHH